MLGSTAVGDFGAPKMERGRHSMHRTALAPAILSSRKGDSEAARTASSARVLRALGNPTALSACTGMVACPRPRWPCPGQVRSDIMGGNSRRFIALRSRPCHTKDPTKWKLAGQIPHSQGAFEDWSAKLQHWPNSACRYGCSPFPTCTTGELPTLGQKQSSQTERPWSCKTAGFQVSFMMDQSSPLVTLSISGAWSAHRMVRTYIMRNTPGSMQTVSIRGTNICAQLPAEWCNQVSFSKTIVQQARAYSQYVAGSCQQLQMPRKW